jgi:hypothetical protein
MGIFDPAIVKGTVTYPLDIVDDRKFNLSGVLEEAWTWKPVLPEGAVVVGTTDVPAGARQP